MRVSACLIVRNEETRLADCLASLAGVADEVCVLDTGSCDDTVALARSLGARVECAPWRDDFAAARNASLELASADWALIVDADERLTTPATQARAALERFAREQVGCVGRALVENLEAGRPVGRVRVSRLVPLDGAHRFRGRVHEQVVLAREGTTAEPARRDVDLTLAHVGYAEQGPARGAKLARNAALLERALEDDPADGYLWFQLGRTRGAAAEPARALEALEQALARCPDDSPWGIQALEEGAYALRALDASRQALALLSEVETRWSERADTCFLVSLLALDTGDLERAERGFLRCLSLAGSTAGAAESSLAASTWAPAFNLGVMAEVRGRTEEARRHYLRALAHHPDHAPSLEGLQRLGQAGHAA